jgi:hypothetical protein
VEKPQQTKPADVTNGIVQHGAVVAALSAQPAVETLTQERFQDGNRSKSEKM